MFELVFSAAHAVYIAGALVGSVILWPVEPYSFHKTAADRESVTAVAFHTQWYHKDTKCRYTGVMVPYVRDWPLEIQHGEDTQVIPPDLEHTAGQALVLNKESCPGEPDKAVFLVNDVQRNFGRIVPAGDFHFDDPDTTKPEYRPKWLKQVMQRINRVGQTDPVAAEVFASIQSTEYERLQAAQDYAEKNGKEAPSPADFSAWQDASEPTASAPAVAATH